MITLFILLFTYFVSFIDKPEKTAPQLSERAMEQRAKWNIPTDGMDYPVSPLYLNRLRKMDIQIYHVSRWFNGATVEMDAATASKVLELDFVKSVEMTRDDSKPIYSLRKKQRAQFMEEGEGDYGLVTDAQLDTYHLRALHEAGYEGQGILMAVCDGSFHNAQKMSCFRQKELELGHFDFTDDKDDFYGSTGTHGTMCLSAISGLTESYHGAAVKAPYYLMRSEENETESPKEMDNLVAALEKADSLGVNVFSVSLGYALFDNSAWILPKTSLDGASTRVSLAAVIAARKGMLVCVAAGNEGNDEWHLINVPADADSILTVGAVGIDGQIGDFSSFGPTSDGRVKPDVCAVGVKAALIKPNETMVYSNGTSFATPLLAGMAACLWSALPEENAMQIRERIIKSSDRYTTPDMYQYGYGIPNAWKAYTGGEDEGMTLPLNPTNDQPYKIIRGNQVFIVRYGHIYNLAGQCVE